MSILIKGMEMPTHCTECLFWHDGVFEHCIINESIQNEDLPEYAGEYPEACPLVKVPKNHGRLGDLDELYASLKKWLIQNRHSMTEATRVWIHGVLEGIAAAPTIIPAEEGGK